MERGAGGDGGGANVDADSRGKREDEGEREGGRQGEQRVAREKVERGSGARESWRASMAKESGGGEVGKGGTSSASGRLRPEGVRGVEKDARNRREGESDGGRDVLGRTEVI